MAGGGFVSLVFVDGGASGAAMGLSVVDSAMFSTEQNGVDVAGGENCPLSLSPTILPTEDGADDTARNCNGGGVAAGAVAPEARLRASRMDATAVADDGNRTGKMLVETVLRSESSDNAKM